jgi:hypothetical protein
MSNATDNQNPSRSVPNASSSDEGERSNPSGIPLAARRSRKNRNYSSEDEDYVAEVTSKKREAVRKVPLSKKKLTLEEPSKV